MINYGEAPSNQIELTGLGQPGELINDKAREWVGLDGQDYAAKVTCEKTYEFLATKDAKNTKDFRMTPPSYGRYEYG